MGLWGCCPGPVGGSRASKASGFKRGVALGYRGLLVCALDYSQGYGAKAARSRLISSWALHFVLQHKLRNGTSNMSISVLRLLFILSMLDTMVSRIIRIMVARVACLLPQGCGEGLGGFRF